MCPLNGGDPIKNPDTLPTGRNLYGFDPSRIPTPEAWEAGKTAEQLLEQHKAQMALTPPSWRSLYGQWKPCAIWACWKLRPLP